MFKMILEPTQINKLLRKYLILMVLFIFPFTLSADITTTQTLTINKQQYPDKNLDELKKIALKQVKLQAVKKIYGEYIFSNTDIEDGRVQTNSVQNIVSGVINLKGEPQFENNDANNSLKITIDAYATDLQMKDYKDNILKLSLLEAKKEKKKHESEDFYGRWSGYIMSNAHGTTKATILITSSGQSKISFPTLRCGGDLVVKFKDIGYVTFKEFLNYGFDRCDDKDKVVLVKENNNKLQYEEYSQDNEKVAHGTLYREE